MANQSTLVSEITLMSYSRRFEINDAGMLDEIADFLETKNLKGKLDRYSSLLKEPKTSWASLTVNSDDPQVRQDLN
jgi:hypothetical protein